MGSITPDWWRSKPNSTLPIFSAAIRTFLPASGCGRPPIRKVAHGASDRQHRHLHDRPDAVSHILRKAGPHAYRNDRGVMMAAGTVQLFLFQVRRPDPAPVGRELGLFGNPPGIDHISFAVTDVDALYAKLCKAGVVLAGPPEDQSWGARMVGLKDPDGNNLYLLQRL